MKIVTTAPPELQNYTVRKLFTILNTDKNDKEVAQEGLVLATIWTTGEFGDVLVSSSSSSAFNLEDDEEGGEDGSNGNVSEGEVVAILEKILGGAFATETVKEYGVTALVKLSSRFSSAVEGLVLCCSDTRRR